MRSKPSGVRRRRSPKRRLRSIANGATRRSHPSTARSTALAAVRAQVPSLGLVTNGAAAAQRAKIERFELARFFDVIVVEGEAGFGKPDPRVFERALARCAFPPSAR